MNFRNKLRVNLGFLRIGRFYGFVLVGLLEAAFVLGQKFFDAEALMYGQVLLKVLAARYVDFLCSAEVAVRKMLESYSDLNDTLVKRAVFAPVLGPEILPDFVRLEELAVVEKLDSLQVERVIGYGFVGH